jgi:putative flippase GtrA
VTRLPAFATLRQSRFLRFSAVGVVGFLIDAGVLQMLLVLGQGPYLGRLASFLAAATGTWLLNRRYTFRATTTRALHREWLHYLALMVVGGAVNYGVYAACLVTLPLVRAYPVIGVAVGSCAGLVVNFLSARFLVFRAAPPE